jgi:hypothetical protein
MSTMLQFPVLTRAKSRTPHAETFCNFLSKESSVLRLSYHHCNTNIRELLTQMTASWLRKERGRLLLACNVQRFSLPCLLGNTVSSRIEDLGNEADMNGIPALLPLLAVMTKTSTVGLMLLRKLNRKLSDLA